MAMVPKFQFFISSTFTDLRDERRVVMEQILNLGHIPVGMELFQAGNEEQWTYIRKRIEECDYFILLLAERYGSTDASGLSFTQKEYEYAIEKSVPVASFLLEQSARQKWPREFVEHDKIKEINNFRRICSTGRIIAQWSSSSDLANRVTASILELIRDCDRPGLVRAQTWLIDQLKLESTPEPGEVARRVLKAVRDDFSYSGFYRKDQTISIRIDERTEHYEITLVFESTIVPISDSARVLKPKINAPERTEIIGTPIYFVNAVEVEADHKISKRSRDSLTTVYKIPKDFTKIADLHFWSSPVLDFTVRIDRSDSFKFEVYRVTGHSDGDPIAPSVGSTPRGDCLEFIGEGAVFTAQGIKWRISRVESVPAESNIDHIINANDIGGGSRHVQ